MRLLVLGATGQLGQLLMGALVSAGKRGKEAGDVGEVNSVVGVPRSVDIADLGALQRVVWEHEPHWIINAAAYTQVDAAENEPDRAILTNVVGAANAAVCAQSVDARLIYFSTESVFDGRSLYPYSEEDPCNPLSVYSISKRAGEQVTLEILERSYVIRTSWLYSDSTRSNFPARLLAQLTSSNDPVPVVTDLVGNPTPVSLLVKATEAVIESPPNPGIYHVCTSGSATKKEWAEAIALQAGFSRARIAPALSTDFKTAAQRSKNVVLSCTKFCETALVPLPDWSEFYSEYGHKERSP